MIKFDNIWKSYKKKVILRDLNLFVPKGQIYGLLGPNGAGKTTTLNLLCNLMKPDQGSITIDGLPLSNKMKSWIGVAPQGNIIYKTLTCAENLAFFARLYGLSWAKQQKSVRHCLAAVGLSQYENQTAETLSGGLQRRLNLAIALIHTPRLLILDEPTTGLDLEARSEIWELLQRLQQEGMTILLTTHLLEEAERLCQQIGILKGGALVAEGSLKELSQLVPAQEIVTLKTPNEQAAIARAESSGFTVRRNKPDLAIFLPKNLELQEIITLFEGIPLDSISRHPVSLEDIYLEVTQG